jgi:VIT1/CCC1 family predicted Fe2+/Mn2+ transporter
MLCTATRSRRLPSARRNRAGKPSKKIAVSKSAKKPDTVYQLKITLADAQPPIWRRIQVQDCTLDKLHEHIQTVMGSGYANPSGAFFQIRLTTEIPMNRFMPWLDIAVAARPFSSVEVEEFYWKGRPGRTAMCSVVSPRNDLARQERGMPQTPHIEKHFTASETVRDIVIGMPDGLTVPFALAAGLSGAVEATTIIITAGLAEVAAGAIAMGLGGYLAARTDAEHFVSERAREERETEEMPEEEAAEVAAVLHSYGLEDDKVAAVVNSIRADKKRWVDFMMRFELGLEEPDPKRARNSALTIALSYIAGGMVPLSPLLFLPLGPFRPGRSVIVTLLALLVFGYIKGRFTTAKPFRSPLEHHPDRPCYC